MRLPIPVSKKTALIAFVGVAVVFTLLRETGIVDLNLYRSESRVMGTAVRSTERAGYVESNPQPPAAPDVTLCTAENRDISGFLRRDLSSLSLPHPTVVRVLKMHLDGAYWTPLYKSGRCSYSLQMTCGSAFDNAGVMRSNMSGTIDQTVAGVCSAREYKKLLAKKISGIVKDDSAHYAAP